MTRAQDTDLEAVCKRIADETGDMMRHLLQTTIQDLLGAEADSLCGAAGRARSPDRLNSRNGYRSRRWDTRTGSIGLEIPKLRKGSYFSHWLLEPRRRAEQALTQVVAEACLLGVNTRRVDDLVKALEIEGIDKSQVSEMSRSLDERVREFRERPLPASAYPYVWIDALYIKVREGGRISGVAVIQKIMPSSGWQRCRTHAMKNLFNDVPKSAQELVATLVRSVFAQPDAHAVRQQFGWVLDKLRVTGFVRAADFLVSCEEDLLAFTGFPKDHWRQIWSNNPQERLNREIRRRSDVFGIFPNRDSGVRLVGALLAEQHDEWQVTRRYMTFPSQAEAEQPGQLDSLSLASHTSHQ